MPDDDQLQERRRDAKEIETPDELDSFKEWHGEGALLPDNVPMPPGPWSAT